MGEKCSAISVEVDLWNESTSLSLYGTTFFNGAYYTPEAAAFSDWDSYLNTMYLGSYERNWLITQGMRVQIIPILILWERIG
jgi:hypothetical protein